MYVMRLGFLSDTLTAAVFLIPKYSRIVRLVALEVFSVLFAIRSLVVN